MSGDPTVDEVLRAVDALTPAFEASGLDELEVSAGDLHVRLARPRAATAASVAVTPIPAAAPAPPTEPSPSMSPYGEPSPGMRFVTAPLTGVFYAAPSPGARPYLTEGAEVSSGQVIGLIEAMKLFNEIKSDTSGRISRVLVENGTLVKRKQPLLEIDPR